MKTERKKEQLTLNSLIEIIDGQSAENHFIELSDEVFQALNIEMAEALAKRYGASHLIKLPLREIKFFEWLYENDIEIWKDLWGNTDEEPYIVGMSFLPVLLDKMRGYPICDLMNNENYYFTSSHIVDKESDILLESAKTRFMNNEELTIAQLLILQISVSPTDIWHFAYNFNIDLNEAKKAVDDLVQDNALVHLKDAEHLAPFIDF
ncbi:MAG: hypothetical protein N2319_13875 [Candidatus Kapabacteria bacterium]|nr:hypothetical protein [Candidatus Kapabacteria bacterium]